MNMRQTSALRGLPGLLVVLLAAGGLPAGELEPVDAFELVPAVPDADRNAWPKAWEDAFRARLRDLVAKGEHRAPPAVWSSEKSGGGFLALLKGRRAEALAAMRVQDSAKHTCGIDYYWCFHLEKQPRIYFQFGKFQPADFIAKMKEGARLWTAEDPRPNLELILQLDCPDADVAAHARRQLAAMWRSAEQVKAMAAAARGECRNGQPANKIRFAEYLESVLPRWPAAMPQDTPAWRSWWSLIAAGEWMVFEEYERRTNPRPHPQYGIGTGPVGSSWDAGVRGGWVDWRNTDNLRSMREVSVYLFAEETGGELVRKVYKERIRRSARSFYSVGYGEWDSPAYMSLTVVGYLGLYDFAKDREVRLLAKGILDYLATTAAMKYYRGGASGPSTRDYGTWYPGDGGSAASLWNAWLPEPRWPVSRDPRDFLFFSAYRPPAAVVALANRDIALPCEVLASHPTYSNWLPGRDEKPEYHETQYLSRDFQMGSQVEGGTGDGCGGKTVLAHPTRGADYLVATTQAKGNPCVGGNDRIAQCRNAQLWLSGSRKDWRFLLPADAVIERKDGIVFLRFASSWAALHPVNVKIGEADAGLLAPYGYSIPAIKQPSKDQTALPAAFTEGPFSGFAIELADGLHFADYAAFRDAVLAKSKVQAKDKRVEFTAASGAQVAMTWDGEARLPQVERDGKVHDWAQHRALYQPGATKSAPVRLGWKEGRLVVEAGDQRFQGVMDLKAGTYSFSNEMVNVLRSGT